MIISEQCLHPSSLQERSMLANYDIRGNKMYHRHHYQEKGVHPIPRERHIFQGVNDTGDTGLVLSSDAKPRLKWTLDLHQRFIEAVNQLGGAEKATPKSVLKLMGIPGLTLYHLKSHLQKYRLSKNLHQHTINNGSNKASKAYRVPEVNGPHLSSQNITTQTTKNLQLDEAIQMQIEVQQRLHEQLEVQRHLQMRIEAQGKYLQGVLEKAQESLGRKNAGTIGLETAKVQLSELVSQVSNQSAFSGVKQHSNLCQTNQLTDCSVDSCLISCDQDLYDRNLGLKPMSFRAATKHATDDKQRLSMSIGLQDGNRDCNRAEAEANANFLEWNNDINTMKKDKQKSFFPTKLDLNRNDEKDVDSSYKLLDLNGFNCS